MLAAAYGRPPGRLRQARRRALTPADTPAPEMMPHAGDELSFSRWRLFRFLRWRHDDAGGH